MLPGISLPPPPFTHVENDCFFFFSFNPEEQISSLLSRLCSLSQVPHRWVLQLTWGCCSKRHGTAFPIARAHLLKSMAKVSEISINTELFYFVLLSLRLPACFTNHIHTNYQFLSFVFPVLLCPREMSAWCCRGLGLCSRFHSAT